MCNRDNDNRELEFSQFKQIWNHLCTMLREEYLKTLRSIHFQFNSFLSLNERKAFLLLCEKSKCEKISICKCDIFLYLMWIECTLWRRTPARPALDTHPRQSHLTRLAKSEPPHAKLPNCWVSDTTLFPLLSYLFPLNSAWSPTIHSLFPSLPNNAHVTFSSIINFHYV